ncbi:MAG: pyridoxal-phosphate dependent enzyme [Anaerolineae bacterium]
MNVVCQTCGLPYPLTGAPYCCPACGGLYDYASPLTFERARPKSADPGIWRYRSTFGLPSDSPMITLGEGNTPLLWAEAFGQRVAFKCEYANPTGSFKDRGTATLISFLRQRGVKQAIEDSSGNSGASFAAYAARAGMRAHLFVPAAASGPKRRQIAAYGADLTLVPGPRQAATLAAQQAAQQGMIYASHAWLPFNLPGYATLAYELWEQLNGEIGTVVVPVGQGGLLLGLARGFQALMGAGWLPKMPALVGVQVATCAPLLALSEGRPMESSDAPTLAEGVRVAQPLRAARVVESVLDSGGRFVSVSEAEILPGRDELARRGFYVEPTSALIWRALEIVLPLLPAPVVAILTGTGYKFAKSFASLEE